MGPLDAPGAHYHHHHHLRHRRAYPARQYPVAEGLTVDAELAMGVVEAAGVPGSRSCRRPAIAGAMPQRASCRLRQPVVALPDQ